MSAYIERLNRNVAAEVGRAAATRQPDLTTRVAAIVGDGTTTRIPELQRTLDADPRALGAVLRRLGFRRSRVWSGDEYALTQWQR